MHECVGEWYMHGQLFSWKKPLQLNCERENQLEERKRAANGLLLKARLQKIKKNQIYKKIRVELETLERPLMKYKHVPKVKPISVIDKLYWGEVDKEG